MPRSLALLAALACLILVASLPAGCDDPKHDEQYDQINALWLQGYGFNNPNPERAKKGLPLLNFDGTVAK